MKEIHVRLQCPGTDLSKRFLPSPRKQIGREKEYTLPGFVVMLSETETTTIV